MPESPHGLHINSSALATLGAVVGVLAGSFGMWFTLKDRMEKQIETRVTERIKTETKLARLDEQINALREELRQAKSAFSAVLPAEK